MAVQAALAHVIGDIVPRLLYLPEGHLLQALVSRSVLGTFVWKDASIGVCWKVLALKGADTWSHVFATVGLRKSFVMTSLGEYFVWRGGGGLMVKPRFADCLRVVCTELTQALPGYKVIGSDLES